MHVSHTTGIRKNRRKSESSQTQLYLVSVKEMKHWVVSCIAFSLVPFTLCFVIPKLSKESRRLTSLKSLNYGGIQHAGLVVKNVEESKKFFMEVFDFTDDTHLRPTTLPFRGAFLKIGTHFLLVVTLLNSLTHSLTRC